MSKLMRSLGIFGTAGERGTSAIASQRPDMLRRKTIAANARILVAASLLLMPVAMWALIAKAPIGFLLASIGLAAGMVSLSLHHRDRSDEAAIVQVGAVTLAGLALTLIDPRLSDVGLMVTVMGPILAALLVGPKVRLWSWVAVVVALLLGAVGSLAGVPDPVFADETLFASIAAFTVVIGLVAHTTHYINAGFVVHDKAEISIYQQLAEHVHDTVICFASDGEVLSTSQSAETLLGIPRYQLTAAALSERLHVMDRPTYLTAFADANQGGHRRTIEVRMRREDPHAGARAPKFIWVDVRFAPIKDHVSAEGRYEVTAMLRDVTERKDAEVTMTQARRAAEAASLAKSRFLATVGHELRTPLNAVVGFSEMMTSGIGGEMSPTAREYAGLIHQSGKHLLEVVGMLLDMSRIEAGKFEITTAPFQPEDVLPASLSMVETMAKARSITIETNIDTDLPGLLADERACRQILINLLSNAIKFSHEGGVVTVTIKRQGQCVSYSVRDNGIGMAPMALQRIGEAFYQADDGLARQYEGTGLGLSIVKGLVDLHDGTLRAMSEIGAGTTMTVLLPINGPATKMNETVAVIPLYRESPTQPENQWQNEKRKAQ